MSETTMKVMFADDICEIPYMEKNGVYYAKMDSYGRKDMSVLALKALDMMAELDRTVLQCINMSGLYRTIWEEIAQKAENSRSETLEALKQKTRFSPNTEMREQQLTEIFTAAQNSAWDTIRNCVNWLIAECRSRNTIAELSTITLSMMTAA